jgi:hypothetical protein
MVQQPVNNGEYFAVSRRRHLGADSLPREDQQINDR